jgi:hypothetical protein
MEIITFHSRHSVESGGIIAFYFLKYSLDQNKLKKFCTYCHDIEWLLDGVWIGYWVYWPFNTQHIATSNTALSLSNYTSLTELHTANIIRKISSSQTDFQISTELVFSSQSSWTAASRDSFNYPFKWPDMLFIWPRHGSNRKPLFHDYSSTVPLLPFPEIESRILGRPARSPSLYRLSYPGSVFLLWAILT